MIYLVNQSIEIENSDYNSDFYKLFIIINLIFNYSILIIRKCSLIIIYL